MYVAMPHGVIDQELQGLGNDALAQLLHDSMREIGNHGFEDTNIRFFTIMACVRVLQERGRVDLIKKAQKGGIVAAGRQRKRLK